jgi:hypothetical protein
MSPRPAEAVASVMASSQLAVHETAPRSAFKTHAATFRSSRSQAMAASCSPLPRWRRSASPLTVVVFRDDAFSNVLRIQEERFGNRAIASDLTSGFRPRAPSPLAPRRAYADRGEVGPLPSPWEFINMPKLRGGTV